MGEAEFARELNRHIRSAAEQLGAGGDLAPVQFVCECGCMTRVTSTVAAYEAADSVWLDAHRRLEG